MMFVRSINEFERNRACVRLLSTFTLPDVMQYAADTFFNIGGKLSQISCLLEKEHQGTQRTDIRQVSRNHLERIAAECESLGLSTSTTVAKRFSNGFQTLALQEAKSVIDGLGRTISAELTTVVCIRIPSDKREMFEQLAPIWGEEVDVNFPSAAYDISEAGKCLAMGRSTAAVFHCMKPIEVALAALAKHVAATMPKIEMWGYVEQAIKNTFPDPNKQSPEKFVNEAMAFFSSVRTAWRNEVMHVARKYTEDEARVIFETVRTFMRHLATKLHE
jgi:uncharacterized protein (DUF2267 family)